MKKLLCILLSALMVFASATVAFGADAPEKTPDFVPVLRFVASSDTHVLENSDQNEQRIRKMMDLAYSIADADPVYQAVDALLIAGDLTNDGTKTEFDKFGAAVQSSLREGTRFLGVVAKNHDGYVMKRAELRAYYTALTGNNPDFHVVINGYHFIGVSASPNDSKHYDSDQLKWMRQQLDEAVKADPNKPIFVTHHEHVRGTVYGSSLYDGWGVTNFTSLLKKYPQVVDFSGHSHFPLNDPRSIWQGKFTAIGTGAIYYSEFTVEGLRSYHPADSHDTGTCWIVELDAANSLRLRGYDVNEGKLLCEELLKNPADKANRDFTPAKRKAASKAPVFGENAALTVEPTFGGCNVTAPAALSVDGQPIVLYRAYAKNCLGATVAKTWVMPSYYRAITQDTIDLTLTNLGSGDFTVCVVAENAYGKQSAPLQARVTVEGDNAVRTFFARVTQWFSDLKTFFVQLFW